MGVSTIAASLGFSNIASEIGNIKLITNSEKQKMFFD